MTRTPLLTVALAGLGLLLARDSLAGGEVGSQVHPVGGREVVEGEQHVAVLLQTLGGLRVAGAVELPEAVAGVLGLLPGVGHVHLVEQALGVGTYPLGQLVQDVARLVHPALLGTDPGEDLLHRLPEAQGAVGDGQKTTTPTGEVSTRASQVGPGPLLVPVGTGVGDGRGWLRGEQHQDFLDLPTSTPRCRIGVPWRVLTGCSGRAISSPGRLRKCSNIELETGAEAQGRRAQPGNEVAPGRVSGLCFGSVFMGRSSFGSPWEMSIAKGWLEPVSRQPRHGGPQG